MEEILHQLIGGLSHYSEAFYHPRWCRISSIHSRTATPPKLQATLFAEKDSWNHIHHLQTHPYHLFMSYIYIYNYIITYVCILYIYILCIFYFWWWIYIKPPHISPYSPISHGHLSPYSHLLVGICRHAILTIPGDAIGRRHVLTGEAHGQEASLAKWRNR